MPVQKFLKKKMVQFRFARTLKKNILGSYEFEQTEFEQVEFRK
jgi:hypothetical protein